MIDNTLRFRGLAAVHLCHTYRQWCLIRGIWLENLRKLKETKEQVRTGLSPVKKRPIF